ncbi:MAG: Serine/threonine-protein kinase PrkC [Lentisphaerae bacterium ADurb.Bin242]|nr:MAG: Serine/threonine-protein kinase PrkC [Lentisphaerae bacterium ADurb.Bin242]
MNAVKPKIPNFAIVELCGRGGSSEVWLGIDDDGIKRAIRIMDKVNEETAHRIEAESKAIALYRNVASQHANLLEILYIGKTPKYLYYVTELADNVAQFDNKYEPDTLAWRIQNSACTPDEVIGYIEAILDGIEQLHTHHIAHHDLKPENILFVKKILKVADPGLIASSRETLHAGTSGFHPPWDATGIEADIYAIGKIIYCLFTREDATKFPEIPDTLQIEPWALLNEIALKCCELDPAARYKTIQEIRQDIEKRRKPSSLRTLRERVRKKGVILLLILLGLSLSLNFYFLWGHCFGENLSDKDAGRLLLFTYHNINSMSLREIDRNLSILKNGDPAFLKVPNIQFLHAQVKDYADWLRYSNVEDNSIFLVSLVADMNIFDTEERQLSTIRRFLVLNPKIMNSPYLLYHYYLFSRKKHDDRQAEKILARLKSLDYSRYNKFVTAYSLLKLSNFLAGNGNNEDALFFSLKARELTPNNVVVYASLFQAYYNLGRYDEAMTVLRKLHSLRPKSSCIDYFYQLLVQKGLKFSLD